MALPICFRKSASVVVLVAVACGTPTSSFSPVPVDASVPTLDSAGLQEDRVNAADSSVADRFVAPPVDASSDRGNLDAAFVVDGSSVRLDVVPSADSSSDVTSSDARIAADVTVDARTRDAVARDPDAGPGYVPESREDFCSGHPWPMTSGCARSRRSAGEGPRTRPVRIVNEPYYGDVVGLTNGDAVFSRRTSETPIRPGVAVYINNMSLVRLTSTGSLLAVTGGAWTCSLYNGGNCESPLRRFVANDSTSIAYFGVELAEGRAFYSVRRHDVISGATSVVARLPIQTRSRRDLILERISFDRLWADVHTFEPGTASEHGGFVIESSGVVARTQFPRVQHAVSSRAILLDVTDWPGGGSPAMSWWNPATMDLSEIAVPPRLPIEGTLGFYSWNTVHVLRGDDLAFVSRDGDALRLTDRDGVIHTRTSDNEVPAIYPASSGRADIAVRDGSALVRMTSEGGEVFRFQPAPVARISDPIIDSDGRTYAGIVEYDRTGFRRMATYFVGLSPSGTEFFRIATDCIPLALPGGHRIALHCGGDSTSIDRIEIYGEAAL